jgi:hypothetical protein
MAFHIAGAKLANKETVLRNPTRVCVLALTLFAASALGAGCGSQPTAPPGNQAQLRPIDKVREGILAVKAQLETTLASARAVSGSSSQNLRANREMFSRDLRAAEQRAIELRSDAQVLRDRAAEYLVLWGAQTTVVTSQGRVGNKTNEPRQAGQASYDEMVAALQQARDVVVPMLTDLQKMEKTLRDDMSGAELQSIRTSVEGIAARESKATALLDTAVTKLDEVKAAATAANAGTPGPR